MRGRISFLHNRLRFDENFHLESEQNLAIQQLLNREKSHYKQFYEKIRFERDRFNKRLSERGVGSGEVPPEKVDDWYYFTKDDPYFECWRKQSLNDSPQLVFSIKDLPQVSKFDDRRLRGLEIPNIRFSDDHTKVLYTFDIYGNEKWVLGYKDIKKGTIKQLTVGLTAEWDSSGRNIYYTSPDENSRPFKVSRIDIQTGEITEIYTEEDPAFYVDLTCTKDKKYIVLNSNSKSTSEVSVIDRATGKCRNILPRKNGVRTFLEHNNGYFYLVTNDDGAIDYKIQRLADGNPIDQAEEFLPYEPGLVVEEIDVFENFLAVYAKRLGLPVILVHNLTTGERKQMDTDELCQITPGANLDHKTDQLRLNYSSPTKQQSSMNLDMNTYKLNILHEKELHGRSLDPTNFISEMYQVPAHDGETIPVSLFSAKGMERSRSNRLLLKGYGAYGTVADHSFKYSELVSAEEGWVIANAHVRGDADKGRDWHQQGMLEKKGNSFQDYLSVANWLVGEGYTSPNKLAGHGVSAGGLLVGNVVNTNPGLFAAIVMQVPFVDVLSLMLNHDLPLTASETEEWGDPLNDPKAFDLIRSYSPYENILQQEYPPMYLTLGLRDMRVPFWSILKYIKRLRERSHNPDQLYVDVSDTGHFENTLEDDVSMWSFLNHHIKPSEDN